MTICFGIFFYHHQAILRKLKVHAVSVKWPDDGKKRLKHVAIKIKEANN